MHNNKLIHRTNFIFFWSEGHTGRFKCIYLFLGWMRTCQVRQYSHFKGLVTLFNTLWIPGEYFPPLQDPEKQFENITSDCSKGATCNTLYHNSRDGTISSSLYTASHISAPPGWISWIIRRIAQRKLLYRSERRESPRPASPRSYCKSRLWNKWKVDVKITSNIPSNSPFKVRLNLISSQRPRKTWIWDFFHFYIPLLPLGQKKFV